MKKIFIIFLFCVSIINQTFGVTLCAKKGTYIGILRKSINGNTAECTNSVDAQDSTIKTKTWKIDYGYKTITGYAACNTISGTYATSTTNLYTTPSDEGIHCWCKMEPVEAYGYETGIASYWVLNKSYADETSCAAGCATQCATDMAATPTSTFRNAILEAIW